ncbi:MAG TPA: DUF302 domain-containing protein [Thiobacillaceae bacterium]|nr:DUF302 domain-containing protein [Thiobacillaceae bacterium]HNU62989.1 DUF302 domain-containing protein [Thiobacillaceae bacterium]
MLNPLLTLLVTSLMTLSLSAQAQQAGSQTPATPPALGGSGSGNPYLQYTPPPTFPFNPLAVLAPHSSQPAGKPYMMRRAVTQQEKIQMMQMALPIMTNIMGMQMADSMNYFARKYKVKPGLSFADVKESLMLRANQLNVKFVGENQMWKDFQAVLNDKESPRIEVYSFCDIAVARDLLKISPEFVVFLPCRVVIMEDGNKELWILMLDWSLDWVKGFERQLGISPELLKGAIDLNARMDEMLQAAAAGDL